MNRIFLPIVLLALLLSGGVDARPTAFSGNNSLFSGLYGAGLLSTQGDGVIITAPANTVAPVASGTARVGETLSVTDGTWTGTAPITYTYQWRRDGVNIGSATNSTYVLVTADLGTAIDCNVTATNAAGAVTQDSNNITVGSDLGAVLASALFDLDATKSASYSGSGTTWANLVTAPADGSAQTDYDFYTGNGSTSTTYPTFNGSAGSAAAYWSFDGGDYFGFKSGSNTAFLNALHKTTGGSDFWIAIIRYEPDLTFSTGTLFSTGVGFASNNEGIIVRTSTNETAQMIQGGDSGVVTASSDAYTTSGVYTLLIMSHSHSGNNTRIWKESATASDVAHTFNATTDNPANPVRIGSETDGGAMVRSGLRMVTVAMGNEYLDNTKAAAIIAVLEARHARDYTP